ncbi:hypothetical protein L6452_02982 [Arctium lappa]|uniref:Uncharacterized protein n=1 Tax=Arctium lappa TaxID=4217 RepID=A0ACB9FLY2_ARCLA|nr:hypothetical protein L6452_02982 [Arctium lappa]
MVSSDSRMDDSEDEEEGAVVRVIIFISLLFTEEQLLASAFPPSEVNLVELWKFCNGPLSYELKDSNEVRSGESETIY